MTDEPIERLEWLASSGYPGAASEEEKVLVRNWVVTGIVNGIRRVTFRAAR